MSEAASIAFEVKDLSGRIGSEIRSDKASLLSGNKAQEIRAILERRGVVVFPQINFSDDEQIAFTKTLGIMARDTADRDEGIYKITMDSAENPQAEYLKAAFYWHIDGTTSEIPILASIMSCKHLSPEGGETEFSNTYAAYDDLTDEDKARYEGVRVYHSFVATQRYVNPEPHPKVLKAWRSMGGSALPLVWTHRSGRKSLVLGATAEYVVGMSPEESYDLLTDLRHWATKPQFVYRHRWSIGDMVIWDNTGTMHRAMPYDFNSGRMMHRTKLAGEEPFA